MSAQQPVQPPPSRHANIAMPGAATRSRPGGASDAAPGATSGSSNAVWNLGFRPFYLAAALFAAFSVPLWVAQFTGLLPFAYVGSPALHGSEMIFGYTLAVVAGFLFTAVRNWTGAPTPSGAPLAALVVLWIAGRLLAATPYARAAAVVDVAFPLLVAAAIARPLLRAGKRRNLFFVLLLVVLAGDSLLLHLAALDILPLNERTALRVALDVLLFIMAVMGGRVIPMFTANGVPGTQPRRLRPLEMGALAGIVLLALADVMDAGPVPTALLCALLFAAHACRLALWQPWRTLRVPLVWILHAAYGWIVLHLLLRAAAALGLVPESVAIHALTVGGIGGLTLGMMTRTARGHTGRPLRADARDVAIYSLVMLAALARALGVLIGAAAFVPMLAVGALAWMLAFVVYVVAYAPFLLRARVDGKPG